jgi:hypothetical protein
VDAGLIDGMAMVDARPDMPPEPKDAPPIDAYVPPDTPVG